jgi:hypothetical protein
MLGRCTHICRACDGNGDGTVSISDLVTAVGRARLGC